MKVDVDECTVMIVKRGKVAVRRDVETGCFRPFSVKAMSAPSWIGALCCGQAGHSAGLTSSEQAKLLKYLTN